MTFHKLSVQVAINSWRLVVERANKIFSSLTEDQLLKEVAPGRNRLIYLWGHLTAIHDAMSPVLGLGERLHPELDAIFVSSPDKTGAQLPTVGELRKYWDEVNAKLLSQLQVFPRTNGCSGTMQCPRKTMPKIRPGTDWLFC
jgi:DinB superfamily